MGAQIVDLAPAMKGKDCSASGKKKQIHLAQGYPAREVDDLSLERAVVRARQMATLKRDAGDLEKATREAERLDKAAVKAASEKLFPGNATVDQHDNHRRPSAEHTQTVSVRYVQCGSKIL